LLEMLGMKWLLSMLNDPRSHGLWEKTAPAAPKTTALQGDLTADVVIVGGGFTGLSTALHLAEKGTRAIVLEGIEIGYGGSGRNVGLVNAGMWVMPDDLPGVLVSNMATVCSMFSAMRRSWFSRLSRNTRLPAKSRSKVRFIALSAKRA
jgi:hypothetical protein